MGTPPPSPYFGKVFKTGGLSVLYRVKNYLHGGYG